MGGKGGDSGGSYSGGGPGMASEQQQPSQGDVPIGGYPPPTVEIPTETTMPTQGDDAKTPTGTDDTPSGGGGDTTGTGGDSGTKTGDVAASTLAAPQYWFNQPVSTLAPKTIPRKGGSIKTTGSV